MTKIRLRASDLAKAISELPKNRQYTYVNPKNKGRIVIHDVQLPEGPIEIKRFNSTTGGSLKAAKVATVSDKMLWRVANAIREGVPFNIDRILGASYNTRSVLESLLAHCPQFYVCRPGRVEMLDSTSAIRPGHKHLLWNPDKPHPLGKTVAVDTGLVISEQSVEAVYEAVTIPDSLLDENIGIEVARRHAQIQIALILIGRALGFRSYIAKNDQAIVYGDKALAELPGVVTSLDGEPLLLAYPDAVKAGAWIDCVWFRNNKFMPAVLEIEHSTGVNSGLVRMEKFRYSLPPFETRFVIVAPDEDRGIVMDRCSDAQFKELKPFYFPYSGVEEFYALVTRRTPKGISDQFIDSFLERVNN